MSYPRFLQRLFANGGAGPKLLGSIIPFGAGNPKAHGAASPGVLDEAARADHVHPGYSAVTQSANGLMSSSDKAKLDGIASGAQVNPGAATAAPKAAGTAAVGTSAKYAREDHVHPAQTIPGNMKGATASTAGAAGLVPAPAAGSQATKYLRADGTWQTPPDHDTTYGAATQSAAGLMSVNDKKKLDGIAAGATAVSPATIAPKSPGTAAVGTSAKYAREDHVHPAQAIPGNMKGATASTAGAAGLVPAPAAGSQATKYLRADGTWQTPPDNNTTYSAATQTASGLMSAADKTKLDSLAANGMVPVFDISDPAYNRVDLALNTEYTAPTNGYIIFSAHFLNAAHVTWGGGIWSNIDMSGVNNSSGTMETCRLHHAIIFPVAKGQKILFRADTNPNSISYHFYAAK